MAKYLVTGAAGFIAAKVCEQLLEQKHTIVGVDNLNDYYDVRLKHWRLGQLQKGRGFFFYPLDIENRVALDKVFGAHKFDAVLNLAARAGVRASLKQPELYERTNVLGEENVLVCQVKHGVKKHVLASSSSKRKAEQLACAYHEQHGLDVSVLRYFTVFGPAGRPDMAPFRFIKWIDEGRPIKLYGDGNQARDFTYVDDIARGTILALKPLGCEIINLGGGQNPMTLKAVISLMERALGKKAEIATRPASPADMKETWADITKAQRLLGWAPETSAEEGFLHTVEWHTTNRELVQGIKV
jgi:UDP-glucuronate 4-epimerase